MCVCVHVSQFICQTLLSIPPPTPLTSLCSRAKEEDTGAGPLPSLPCPPSPVVAQPESVSQQIAEQLAKAAHVETEAAHVETEAGDLEEEQEPAVDRSFHISGDNIDLDDLDEHIDEPLEDSVIVPEEEDEAAEEEKEEERDDLKKTKEDTTTVITNMLSELANECDSREAILGH